MSLISDVSLPSTSWPRVQQAWDGWVTLIEIPHDDAALDKPGTYQALVPGTLIKRVRAAFQSANLADNLDGMTELYHGCVVAPPPDQQSCQAIRHGEAPSFHMIYTLHFLKESYIGDCKGSILGLFREILGLQTLNPKPHTRGY